MLQARQKLDRWRALAGADPRLVIALGLSLPAIGGALRIIGMRRTYRALAWTLPRSAEMREVDDDTLVTAKRLGRLVSIAARHGPYNATCLRQSFALWWLLRRRRLPAELRIGVGKNDGGMQAHAWVELAGHVINDSASIGQRYTVYADLDRHLPQRAFGR